MRVKPKKYLGQNFIFDQNILNKIISNILPIKNFNIIEIGPGPGGLTLAILKNSGHQRRSVNGLHLEVASVRQRTRSK